MISCTFTHTIAFPVELVTAAVTDPTRFPVWRDHFHSVDHVSGPPGRPTARYRTRIDERGNLRDGALEVLDAQRDSASYRIEGGSVAMTETWTVRPADDPSGDPAGDPAGPRDTVVTLQLEVEVPVVLTAVVTREAASDMHGQWAALDRALQQGRIGSIR